MVYGISVDIVRDLHRGEALRKVVEAGFTQVELSCGGQAFEDWWNDPRPLGRALRSHGLKARSVHSPGSGWNNGAKDETVRLASVDAASVVFGPAASIGVEVVVCHPNMSTDTFVEDDYEDSIRRSIDSLAILAERARAAGVRMAVENLPRRGLPRPGGTVEDILRMIEGLGDHVGVCLDVGHANANGLRVEEEVRIAGDRVFNVHLQDNDGQGEDQHLVPGTGTVTWDVLLDALDAYAPDAIRTLEVPLRHETHDETLAVLAELRRTWEDR